MLDFFKNLSSKPPGRDEFAALVMRALANGRVRIGRYDEKTFSLVREDGLKLQLQNGYARFCAADKSNRHAILVDIVSGIAALGTDPPDTEDFSAVRPRLLPLVRSAAYSSLTYLDLRASGKADPSRRIATHQLAEDLVACLAIDAARSISIVNQQMLDRWQVGFPEALSVACDNLRVKTRPNCWAERGPGLFVGRWDDSYETSRILLSELMYRLPLDGDPVVFAPSRNQLWVTGSNNTSGLKSMLQFGQEEHFGAYPLSPHLFVLNDRQWGSFQPESAALRETLRLLVLRRQGTDYAQQKKTLDAIHEKEGSVVFVSPCQFPQDSESGRRYSICVWPRGGECLLPLTEKVAFLIDPASKESVTATWPAMQSVTGHRLEKEADLFPERYRVRSFPSDEEIAAMRRAAANA